MRRSLQLLALSLLSGCGATSAAHVETAAPAPTADDATAAMLGLGASVDPSLGVLVSARIEDPSDGEGRPPIASGLRCGAAIDELGAQLSDYVSDRRAMTGVPLDWSCSQDRCELRGMMEFDPTRVLHFRRDPARGWVVTGVDLFDEPTDGAGRRAELDAEQRRSRPSCP